MEKKIAYLACPYSVNADEELMEKRFMIANEVAFNLMNQGIIIFSPISMSHPIANFGNLPKNWDFWCKFDEAYLQLCYKMYVIMIDGWKESTGVQAEIKMAERLGIEIEYIDFKNKGNQSTFLEYIR